MFHHEFLGIFVQTMRYLLTLVDIIVDKVWLRKSFQSTHYKIIFDWQQLYNASASFEIAEHFIKGGLAQAVPDQGIATLYGNRFKLVPVGKAAKPYRLDLGPMAYTILWLLSGRISSV
jgi:hypothetical protein